MPPPPTEEPTTTVVTGAARHRRAVPVGTGPASRLLEEPDAGVDRRRQQRHHSHLPRVRAHGSTGLRAPIRCIRGHFTCNIDHPNICMRFMVRFAHGPLGDNIGFHEIPKERRRTDRVRRPTGPAVVGRLRASSDSRRHVHVGLRRHRHDRRRLPTDADHSLSAGSVGATVRRRRCARWVARAARASRPRGTLRQQPVARPGEPRRAVRAASERRPDRSTLSSRISVSPTIVTSPRHASDRPTVLSKSSGEATDDLLDHTEIAVAATFELEEGG